MARYLTGGLGSGNGGAHLVVSRERLNLPFGHFQLCREAGSDTVRVGRGLLLEVMSDSSSWEHWQSVVTRGQERE